MKKLNILICLLVITLSAASQIPVVSVRFANPQFHCSTLDYTLDVEFKSSVANKQLYGMNIRFFYDDVILEYMTMENFATGYSPVSPSPALIKTDHVNNGSSRFGFPAGHALEFVNGAIQQTSTTTIILPVSDWVRIFTIRFHVDDPNSVNIPNFTPSVIWDLESDPVQGGWLNGDDGVVISLVAPSPRYSSPATETAEQFNWQYSTAGATYGAPAAVMPVSTLTAGPAGISISAASTAVNAGDAVTFTAMATNGGSLPIYQWFVNGVQMGGNSAQFTYTPNNNDAISCILTSSETCVTNNPATSNTIIMEVSGVSQIVNVNGIAIYDGQTECYNATKVLTIAGNGTTFAVMNGGHATMIAGERIFYKPGTVVEPGGYMHGYITTNNQYCGYQPPALPSNITAGTSEKPASDSGRFLIYPNPTTGKFTLEQTIDRKFKTLLVRIIGMEGQEYKKVVLKNKKQNEFNVSELPDGIYFVKILADGEADNLMLVKVK